MKRYHWFLIFAALLACFGCDGARGQCPTAGPVNCAAGCVVLYFPNCPSNSPSNAGFWAFQIGTGFSVNVATKTITGTAPVQTNTSVVAALNTNGAQASFTCSGLTTIPVFASATCPPVFSTSQSPLLTTIATVYVGLVPVATSNTAVLHIGTSAFTSAGQPNGLSCSSGCAIDNVLVPGPGEFPIAKFSEFQVSGVNVFQQLGGGPSPGGPVQALWNGLPALPIITMLGSGVSGCSVWQSQSQILFNCP